MRKERRRKNRRKEVWKERTKTGRKKEIGGKERRKMVCGKVRKGKGNE